MAEISLDKILGLLSNLVSGIPKDPVKKTHALACLRIGLACPPARMPRARF
jgi:hypothetical protein